MSVEKEAIGEHRKVTTSQSSQTEESDGTDEIDALKINPTILNLVTREQYKAKHQHDKCN